MTFERSVWLAGLLCAAMLGISLGVSATDTEWKKAITQCSAKNGVLVIASRKPNCVPRGTNLL